MAAANASCDAARVYSDESDSDGEFEGFSASDIERASSTAIHRNSDDEVDIDDLELDSDSDTDSDATIIANNISGSDDEEPGPARPQPARPPRRRIAQPRRPSQSPWSGNLVNQAGLPYQRRTQTGLTDREQASELSPFGLFTLFFTDYLLRDIVSETNRYAGQCLSQPPKQGEKHLPWHPLTVPECRTWLGMLLTTCVVQKVGRLADYWSRNAATLTPSFGKTMPCLRFLQILRYLHFVDNEGADTDKMLKTWKVQKLLDYLVKRYRDVYTPRRKPSVDETMLKFKGRLSIKQYIKIKPAKWGIKLFTLAESTTGYVLDLLPYTGKRAETAMSKTAQTVLDVSRHFLNLGHHFFFDNYYTSIELLHALAAKNSLCCDTVNANRVGLPSDMKKTCAAVKKLKLGENVKRMSGVVLAVTWMDTRAVNLLCNIPGCLGDADVQRRDKRTGAEITISRPKAIELYNSFMCGVDLSDQRVATYRRHIKSLTWYMQIYFHMFQLTVVQAFLLHRELHHDSKMTQHDFFLKLIDGLVGGRTYLARCGRPSAEPRVQDARFNRQLEHAPVKLATSSKCAVHTRRVDTLFACSACNVRMCPYPCFHRYHYMVEYGYVDPTKAGAAPARKRKR